jgi:hypothetical protein
MFRKHIVAITAILSCGLSLSSARVEAQDIGRYRDMGLGSSLASVAAANGLTTSDAKIIHQRPAIIHDLEWRSTSFLSAALATGDPVRELVFSFYNDQLFRIVVNYDKQRTEGLTDADLIGVVSAIYGSPTTLATTKPRASESQQQADRDTVIGRWENADATVTLLRAQYPTPVSLVVLSKRLSGLARAAQTEALRLDRIEAPQREVDRLKNEAAVERASGEKARFANKATFKP